MNGDLAFWFSQYLRFFSWEK